jgi:hypothetical protein
LQTLQSLNPENATPTSKQPKLCTLSLQKKKRESERERGFGFLCADVGKDLQHHQSRQIHKDEMRKHAICRTSANEDLAKKDSSRFQEFKLSSQELCEID